MTGFLLQKGKWKYSKISLVWLMIFTMLFSTITGVFAQSSNENSLSKTNLLKLKDVPIGSIIVDEKSIWEFRDGQNYLGKVYKNEPVKWKLISQDYFGNNKSLLVSDESVAFNNFDKNTNDFMKSDINKWLKDTFYKHFSTQFKGALDSFENSGKNNLRAKGEQISLLSASELGIDNNDSGNSKIEYFSNAQTRILTEDSTGTKRSVKYWTSSPYEKESNKAYTVLQSGDVGNYDIKNSLTAIRPAINIKGNTLVGGPFEKNGQAYYILFEETTKIEKESIGINLNENIDKNLKDSINNNLKETKSSKNGFKNVTYKLKKGVEEIDAQTANMVANSIVEGKIRKEKLQSIGKASNGNLFKDNYKYPGKIFVSKEAGKAFKLMENDSGPESVEEEEGNTVHYNKSNGDVFAGSVKIQDILEDVNIPEQKVNLTKDLLIPNSSDLLADENNAEGIEVTENTTQQQQPTTMNTAPKPPSVVEMEANYYSLIFKLKNYKKKIDLGEGKSSFITLNGAVTLEAPHIEGYYSWNDGYKLALKAKEEVSVQLKADFQLKEKQKILLYGFNIDAEIGSAYAGLFLVIDVDGNINMEFDFTQGAVFEAGIKGGTTWGFPTSVNPYDASNVYGNANIDISGKIKGKAALLVGMGLTIFGCEVINIDAQLGLIVECSFGTDTPEPFFVTADIYLKVTAKVDYYFDSKKVTVINFNQNLFKKYQRLTGDYKIILDKVCAYEDVVKGQIINKRFDPPAPYTGKTKIKVNNSQEYEVDVVDGMFLINNVELAKGSKVEVKVPQSELWSNPSEATFPFNEVSLKYADYFNKAIDGVVQSAIGHDGRKIYYNGPIVLKNSDNNSVIFRGIAENGLIKANGKMMGKEELNKIKRNSPVILSLEKDGFVIDSPIVHTDGLIISKINIENLRISYQYNNGKDYVQPSELETYRADKVRLFVSNERGEEFPENIPTGRVDIRLGMDLPHRLEGWNKNYAFETNYKKDFEYINPIAMVGTIYNTSGDFKNCTSKVISLKPFPEGVAMAVAEIENVEATVVGNPVVRKDDFSGDRHFFEGVKYYFENETISYYLRDLSCRFCFADNPYRLEYITDKMSKAVLLDNSFKDIKLNVDLIDIQGEFTNPSRINTGFDQSTLSSWAIEGVNDANKAGLTTDRILGNFNNNITREEFAGLAVKLYEALSGKKAEPISSNPFSDTVDVDVLKAKNLGIINGVSGTSFAPSKTVTRQEMCVMLQKTALAAKPDMSVDAFEIGSFADEDSIATWAKSSVKWASKTGIMGGIGNNQINPLGMATREQAIVLVNKAKANLAGH
jgi:hypothetical protein